MTSVAASSGWAAARWKARPRRGRDGEIERLAPAPAGDELRPPKRAQQLQLAGLVDQRQGDRDVVEELGVARDLGVASGLLASQPER